MIAPTAFVHLLPVPVTTKTARHRVTHLHHVSAARLYVTPAPAWCATPSPAPVAKHKHAVMFRALLQILYHAVAETLTAHLALVSSAMQQAACVARLLFRRVRIQTAKRLLLSGRVHVESQLSALVVSTAMQRQASVLKP